MDTDQLAKIAHALSDPTRLRIFGTIAANKEVNCGDIICQHELAPGTVSHHLKTLSEAGLIDCRRKGQFVYNRVIPEVLKRYSENLARLAAGKTSKRSSRKS